MALSAPALKADIFAAMQAKGWKVTVATPDGAMTETSLEDLADVIATAVVNHITANGQAIVPPTTFLVGCTGGPSPVVPVFNPSLVPLAIT
jgi:hypothetical protein